MPEDRRKGRRPPGRAPAARPARGRPRGPLSAEGIVSTAVRIADEEGIEAVSIRRIAGELGGRPMSVYDYFAGKEEIFDAMVDLVSANVLVPGGLPAGWRPALRAIAWQAYANFQRHPWLVVLFGRRPSFGPNAEQAGRQAAAAMADTPLGEEERWLLLATLHDYLLGRSLRNLASPRPEQLAEVFPPERLESSPELRAVHESYLARTRHEGFEAGLELVLDAIGARIEAAGG